MLSDQVRYGARGYVVEHLRGDQVVLVVDGTGDVKKGASTVGVQRQRTGPRAGGIQRLFTTLVVQPVHDAVHRLGRSDRRRRHQARSQAGHYRRQATQA
ncbi:hypothetical protein [Streptomyces sp. NRRL S-495]|uniref:hypothetical protein n=1 Tax=Streptomyces sp. NRRL S-495 TaxID=1609133 RepID=UPI00069765BE|nr:hypothetical protein [Streptomyces sp. NRRL S-495]